MRVGLIGCGGIAKVHMESYKRINKVDLVAVCDISIEKAKVLAKKFKVNGVYSNYVDMIEKEKLDMVDICTPVSTHVKIICDVSKLVPAILVEKPMALSTSECEDIIEEVKKHGTKLCISHNQIFLPTIQKAKSLIDSGAFDPLSFRTVVKENFEFLKAHGWIAPWAVSPEQGGVIWEACSHLAYLHLYFLPNIVEVYAVGDKIKYPVYSDFAVLLKTNDKRYGIIELSWLSRETEIVYTLMDKTGKGLEIYRDFDHLIEKSEMQPYNVSSTLRSFLVDEKRVLMKWVKYGFRYFKHGKISPIYLLMNSFIDSIKKDLPPPVSPEDGKKTIALLECIKKSLDQSKPILLPK